MISENIGHIQNMASQLKENIGKVIVGKDAVLDLIITAMICSGHILLEDIPGTGKTMMAKALSKSLSADFSRIQFTPDLLPSDLIGLNYYNQKVGEFVFKRGPLMNQIVLADEINRATPRTQSSLLEAMEEHQITVDGVTYRLKEPFFVMATQNPLEIAGTFPLPEAQLDRFFMQLSMGYPSRDESKQILNRFRKENPLEDLVPVVTAEALLRAREMYSDVHMSEDVMDYMLELIDGTRSHDAVSLGVSPRGALALYKGTQAYAALQGRAYVLPDDVKRLFKPILAHRIKLVDPYTTQVHQILDELLLKTEVPTEKI